MSAESPTGTIDPLRLYLDGIGQYELLTAEQERDLSYKIIEGRQAWDLLIDSRPTSEAEILNYEQVFLAGLDARNEFINSNLRLVVSIAKRYKGATRTLDLLDLIQEGNIGLERAVEKFDPSKGFKFSTYSTWWIRQAVTRYLDKGDSALQIPSKVGSEIRSANRNDYELTKKQSAAYAIASVVSLDAGISTDSEATILDFLPDPNSARELEKAEMLIDAEPIKEALSTLTSQEREIIEMRFGITAGNVYTFKEIGKMFGFTPQNAANVANRALRKLRHHFKVSA